MESKVGKLDVDKLLLVPANLNKLSNVVENDVLKKDLHNVEIKILKIKYLVLLT